MTANVRLHEASITAHGSQHRPRTRAWVQQENENRARRATSPRLIAPRRSARQQASQPGRLHRETSTPRYNTPQALTSKVQRGHNKNSKSIIIQSTETKTEAVSKRGEKTTIAKQKKGRPNGKPRSTIKKQAQLEATERIEEPSPPQVSISSYLASLLCIYVTAKPNSHRILPLPIG
jgi:hypothetical protein